MTKVDTITNFKQIIKDKTYIIDDDIKNNVILIHSNCVECEQNLKDNFSKLNKSLKPDYNYQLLIDIISKPKSEYIEYFNTINEMNDDGYKVLLNKDNEYNIPNNIQIIYSNYLLCINMIYKELYYLKKQLKLKNLKISKYKDDIYRLIQNGDILQNDIHEYNKDIKQINLFN